MADEQGFATTNVIPEDQKFVFPVEGDEKVGDFFYNKFVVARNEKHRLDFHAKWFKNYELLRGRHFQIQSGVSPVGGNQGKWPLIPVNLPWMIVSRTKAHLTDNKPRFEIVGHDELAEDEVPIINSAAIAWWKRTRQQRTLSDSVINSETYGSSVEKMIFNSDLEAGLGDIDTVIVDPFKFFPWPGIRDIQRMPMFFEVEILELAEIVKRWPDKGSKVTADKQFSDELTAEDRELVKAGSLAHHRAQGNLPNNYSPSGGKVTQGLERAMVIECWIRDYSLKKVTEQQPVMTTDFVPDSPTFGQEIDSGETEGVEVEAPKYPGFIRVVHLANEGKIILDDIPNPSINPELPIDRTSITYLFDRYPYSKNDANSDTSNFWGFSSIEQIEILVREINKKISQIAAYIDKTVRPTVIIPKNLGIEDHHVSNLPGQKWWVTNPTMSQFIRYLEVPGLPRDFYLYLEMLFKLVDNLSGIHDVSEGRKPKGISAASAIIALQEKAQTMFREKIRNLDLLLEERGRMFISHMQNWYTESRTLRLSGKDVQALGGLFTKFRGSDLTGEFTFEVVPGSTMPKSMWVRRDQSLALYQNGAIDQQALLDEFDYPNRDEIIKRMELGQLGVLLEKLSIAGMPPEILESIQQIASMDEKQFKQTFLTQPPASGGASTGEPKSQPGGKKS